MLREDPLKSELAGCAARCDAALPVPGPAEIVECENDQVAIAKAKEALDGRPIEVWEQSRVVAHLDPAHSK